MFCAPKLLIYFQLVEHMCVVFSKPCHSSCNARFHISDVFSSRNSMTFGRSTSQNDFLFFSFSSFFSWNPSWVPSRPPLLHQTPQIYEKALVATSTKGITGCHPRHYEKSSNDSGQNRCTMCCFTAGQPE